MACLSTTTRYLQWYRGESTTPSIYTALEDVLEWPDTELEKKHNYIQLLFPLPEPSKFNTDAPIVTEEVYRAFRTDPQLKRQLIRCFARMLRFYGFELTMTQVDGPWPVTIKWVGGADPKGKCHWLMASNHNHLRITRIIRSLRILGLPEYAREFFRALLRVVTTPPYQGVVSNISRNFWNKAAIWPMWVAPGDDWNENDGQPGIPKGLEFLDERSE